jgi:hypothetical protein
MGSSAFSIKTNRERSRGSVALVQITSWQGLTSGNITFADELDFDVGEIRCLLDGNN